MEYEDDDNDINEKKDSKTHISKRIGNDFYIYKGDGSVWGIKNYYTGKKRKDEKRINTDNKRVGNDLYQYKYNIQ